MSQRSAVTFYDASLHRLLADYASGNRRVEAAIRRVLSSLPAGEVSVLDVGCGVGWSSNEIVRHRPEACVVGVDLSPRLIASARTLFDGNARVSFTVADLTRDDLAGREFDVIALLDVYEHIPADARAAVHGQLSTLLAENGRVVLTCPTVALQRFLRERRPEGLQPVDEDVTPSDIERFARDLGGRVLSLEAVSIWRPDDYLHAIVERGEPWPSAAVPPMLEAQPLRAQRVESEFGLRWTRAAGFVSARGSVHICVATRSVTETFIKQHLEHLPGHVHVLGLERCRDDSGRSLLLPPAASAALALTGMSGHARRRIEEGIARRLPEKGVQRAYSRYLRRHGIRVVLAEYGVMAAGFRSFCRTAGVPIVAHFHGYDAFDRTILDAYADDYRALFAEGWPVVAASESMKAHLVELGAAPEQLHVVPYGVDFDLFRPGEAMPGLVVSVGRFVDKKAPELTLLAFAQAAETHPEARLVMIGDGPLRPSLERLVRALHLERRVRLEGKRGHEWVAERLRQASIFVQHSVVASSGDREGTPVAVLEAGAAGVPVLATRHEGIAEVVRDGETGILVAEGDVAAMGDALSGLLDERDRARRLGAAARERLLVTHSRDVAIGRLWSVLEKAMDGVAN